MKQYMDATMQARIKYMEYNVAMLIVKLRLYLHFDILLLQVCCLLEVDWYWGRTMAATGDALAGLLPLVMKFPVLLSGCWKQPGDSGVYKLEIRGMRATGDSTRPRVSRGVAERVMRTVEAEAELWRASELFRGSLGQVERWRVCELSSFSFSVDGVDWTRAHYNRPLRHFFYETDTCPMTYPWGKMKWK